MNNNFEEHPWLKDYPVSEEYKFLIIGTHPPKPYRGCMPFYYGNTNQFWDILEKAFSESLFYKQTGAPDIEKIKIWLNEKHVAITDMLQYTIAENKFSTDKDILIKDSDYQYNHFLKKWLEEGTIETIFFTSFSEGKSAYALFRKWYKLNYSLVLKKGREIIENGNEEYIDINDKKIRIVILYSPSPAARRGISNSIPYKKWLESNQKHDKKIDKFRLDWYKKYFKNIIENKA